MAKESYLILFILPWVVVAAGAAINEDYDLPGQKFFKSLPENVQPDYLSFELGRGYTERSDSKNPRIAIDDDELVFPDALDIPEDLVEKFQALDVPKNFTENLFEFVRMKFKLDIPSVRTLILQRIICFEDGTCIDLEDVGAHCCPF